LSKDDELREAIIAQASLLGWKPKESADLLLKYPTRAERKIKLKELKNKVKENNRHLEAEHRKRWYYTEGQLSEQRLAKVKNEEYAGVLAGRSRLSLGARLQSMELKLGLQHSHATTTNFDPSVSHQSGSKPPPGVWSEEKLDAQPHFEKIEDQLKIIESLWDSSRGFPVK